MTASSKNSVSHSFTIMPLMSMDGKLASKVLICLQKKGRRFGPQVSKTLQIPDNIYLILLKSGTLDKDWVKT